MLQALRQKLPSPAKHFSHWFWRWVDRSSTNATSKTFHRNNLGILPSGQGLWFLIVVIVMWLVGTNYENNLILGVAFFLLALGLVAIMHTFSNLSGLTMRYLSADPVFSGDLAEVSFYLSKKGKRQRDDIQISWDGSADKTTVALLDSDDLTVQIPCQTRGRGWYDPGRIVIETRYPLGFIRCWSKPKFAARVLVYPKPIAAGPLPPAQALRDDGEESLQRGSDEFFGHRPYQPGDVMRNVAWKQFSRGMGLLTKEYVANVDQRLWLDWDYLAGMDREARLSRLCYWVLEADKTGKEYGLRLPGVEIEPSTGAEHKQRALKALALFEVELS